jgi:predicted RNase H-like HicB family nuclease
MATLVSQQSRGTMRYKVVLESSDEGVAVSVPGLPGCHSQGADEGDALNNIKDAIRDYLAVVDELSENHEVREVEIEA